MSKLPLYIVDAFTATRFRGNPASVCLVESEIPETIMQTIAAEMTPLKRRLYVRSGMHQRRRHGSHCDGSRRRLKCLFADTQRWQLLQ